MVVIAKTASFAISTADLKKTQSEISEVDLERVAGSQNVPQTDIFECFLH
ncbi:lantipeptide precursor/ Nif11-like leader peptide domain protein [Synechococcus sp. RS9909]|nr:lantipeptide precursor/ Nif11-like leader peptide domain protein [Synechococcus sp. RS9909]